MTHNVENVVFVGQSSDWPHCGYPYQGRLVAAEIIDRSVEKLIKASRFVGSFGDNLVYALPDGHFLVGLSDHGTDHTNRDYFLVASKEEALRLIETNVKEYRIKGYRIPDRLRDANWNYPSGHQLWWTLGEIVVRHFYRDENGEQVVETF